jgi:shikimate dehydrogenase
VTRRAYLFGDPVGHSLSPAIHNSAFAASGMDVRYEALRVPARELRRYVEMLREPDVVGTNVTLPHKEAVFALVDDVDQLARDIGAVNTVHNRGGTLLATNTDAVGFSRSLAEAGFDLAGRPAVMLGAGGSARAVAEALLRGAATSLVIANRTLERAERLVSELRARHGQPLEAVQLGDLTSSAIPPDAVVVNTTSVGLSGDDSPLDVSLLPTRGLVVDIIYNPPRTRLLREADAAGVKTLSGLGMLVHQAAAAWEIWTGQSAPIAVMTAAAERALHERQ